MNFGKAVVLLFVIVGVVVYMPDLLRGVVGNEAEIRTTADLIGDLVAMIPFTSQEIVGIIFVVGIFIVGSRYQ